MIPGKYPAIEPLVGKGHAVALHLLNPAVFPAVQ